MNLSVEQVNNILNDLWNFHIVLFGVALTIFTLLYSFILSKRDELKGIAEQVKIGDKNPLLAQRESFAKVYIGKLKKINDVVIWIIGATFLLFIASWISNRMLPDCYLQLKKTSLIVIFSLTLLILLCSILIFVKIFRNYSSDTKI